MLKMKLIIFEYCMYNLIENITMGVFRDYFVYEREIRIREGNGLYGTGTVFKAHKTHVRPLRINNLF